MLSIQIHDAFASQFIFFSIFQLLFSVLFLLVFITIIVTVIKRLTGFQGIGRSPRLTVEATIVAKRSDPPCDYHGPEIHDSHVRTTYYISFQLNGGERIELTVSGKIHSTLYEGERGSLTYQGKRFIGFEPI